MPAAPRPVPIPPRGIVLGVAGTLLAALITAAARSYDHSKLDTSRFERDSIVGSFRLQRIEETVLRIDSTTRRIEALNR